MKKSLASIFLRIGLAGVLLYAAITSFMAPEVWVGYFPAWLTNVFPGGPLLVVFSIYEILLAVWILSSKKRFYSGILMALTMAGVILSNLAALDIVFRDFGILFAALAFAVL